MKYILPHSMKKVCHNDRNVVKLAYAKPPSTDPKIGTFLGCLGLGLVARARARARKYYKGRYCRPTPKGSIGLT